LTIKKTIDYQKEKKKKESRKVKKESKTSAQRVVLVRVHVGADDDFLAQGKCKR
jgi:hypothetical protein